MAQDIIQQILDLSVASVNIPLVIVLLAIGFILKHLIKSLDNSNIPVILIIAGIVISICMKLPFNPREQLLTILVEGIASAMIAMIVQTKAKDIIESKKSSNDTKIIEEETEEQ